MAEKERTGPAQDRPDTTHLSPMVPLPADEWREELARRVERTMRRRAAVADVRAQLDRARQYGLRARYERKLRRSGGGRR